MATICFDLGGTLIDDPFPDATEELKQEVQNGTVLFPFSSKLVDEFFEAWTEHNRSFDFPFASHYLQEEVWLIRAAISIDSNHNLGMGGVLPFRIPVLLSRYRAIAARKVALQPQLPMIRSVIKSLRLDGHCVGVASNDREFATRALLSWAELKADLNFVFTSEGLSEKFPGAEKPAAEFFQGIQYELAARDNLRFPMIYLGDSETGDIIPSLKEGWIAVRFFNSRQMDRAMWFTSSPTTVAPIHFTNFESFADAVNRALDFATEGGTVS